MKIAQVSPLYESVPLILYGVRISIRLPPSEQTNISIRIQCSSGEEAIDFPSERAKLLIS
jgi:hypothetical protein